MGLYSFYAPNELIGLLGTPDLGIKKKAFLTKKTQKCVEMHHGRFLFWATSYTDHSCNKYHLLSINFNLDQLSEN